jgi:hypothetical protein
LSAEQKEMQQLARKFAKEEIIPNAAHYDKTGEVKKNETIHVLLEKILKKSLPIRMKPMTTLEEWLWRCGRSVIVKRYVCFSPVLNLLFRSQSWAEFILNENLIKTNLQLIDRDEFTILVSMAHCEKSSCTWFNEFGDSNKIWFVDFSIESLESLFIDLGGLGLGILDSCIVGEELAYG